MQKIWTGVVENNFYWICDWYMCVGVTERNGRERDRVRERERDRRRVQFVWFAKWTFLFFSIMRVCLFDCCCFLAIQILCNSVDWKWNFKTIVYIMISWHTASLSLSRIHFSPFLPSCLLFCPVSHRRDSGWIVEYFMPASSCLSTFTWLYFDFIWLLGPELRSTIIVIIIIGLHFADEIKFLVSVNNATEHAISLDWIMKFKLNSKKVKFLEGTFDCGRSSLVFIYACVDILNYKSYYKGVLKKK